MECQPRVLNVAHLRWEDFDGRRSLPPAKFKQQLALKIHISQKESSLQLLNVGGLAIEMMIKLDLW